VYVPKRPAAQSQKSGPWYISCIKLIKTHCIENFYIVCVLYIVLYIENFSECVPGTRGRLALQNFLAAAEGRRDGEGRREKEGERDVWCVGGWVSRRARAWLLERGTEKERKDTKHTWRLRERARTRERAKERKKRKERKEEER
jgi:hypothetical protein